MTAKEALRQSGENLKLIREQKGYSIEALAILSGINEQTICNMESGDFNYYISTAVQLAATLKVDFRQILVAPFEYGGL